MITYRLFKKNWSLRPFFGVIVGIPVTLLFGILLVHGFYASRHEAAKSMRTQMVNEVKIQAKTLNHHLEMMSRIPDQIALAITIRAPGSVEEMNAFQYAMLADNPTIYGNAIAWEPYAFDARQYYCSPYVWRDLSRGGAISSMMFNPENDYDYLKGWDWYDVPKKKYLGTPVGPSPLTFAGGEEEKAKMPRLAPGMWTVPYFDEGGGNILMCTYSAPFFKEGTFAGVVTCDVTTDWIRHFLASEAFAGGYFMLLGRNGSIISHPDSKLIMKEIEEIVPQKQSASWNGFIGKMKQVPRPRESDFRHLPPGNTETYIPDNEGEYLPALSQVLPDIIRDKPVWTEGIRLHETGWVLLCIVPEHAVYEAANAQFQSNILIFLFGVLLLSGYLFWQVDHRIIRPVQRLAAATKAIAGGDFNHQIGIDNRAGRELVDLSRNFNTMAGTLRQSIEETVRNTTAKEVAEAGSRAKSEFLMLVSHEFRTPLSGVIGTAELLMQTELTPKQYEYAVLQKESGTSLLLLINNILDFSKLELGGITVQQNDFSLRALADSVFLTLKFQARSRNVSLSRRFADNIQDQVRGDEGRIRQVLLNLLNNAVKFSQNGEVTLRVTPEKDAPPENQIIRFEVTDQGIGISVEQQKTIFNPLWQSDTSSKRHYDGLGLGLTISRHIVESLRGNIGFSSTPGKGSTFWFSVPLQLQKIEPPAVLPATESLSEEQSETKTHHPRQTVHVLVAEDNRINQIVIKEILTTAGYECHIVDNGSKAVQAWKDGSFDLILMDCQMPEVDGYEATGQIRKAEADQGKLAPIPIVALTANVAPGDKERCLQVGMSSYCNKPINSKELIDTIEFWIDTKY